MLVGGRQWGRGAKEILTPFCAEDKERWFHSCHLKEEEDNTHILKVNKMKHEEVIGQTSPETQNESIAEA